jgi:RHS repeat-associated protein
VLLPGGTRSTFLYDGDGRRVRKDESTGTTQFVWDGQDVFQELDGGGSELAAYAVEPAVYGSVLMRRVSGSAQSYLVDGLGSTVGLSGTTLAYVYDAYGTTRSATGTGATPFRYVGRLGYYYDSSTGLYYVWARHYNAMLARWLSMDPLGLDAEVDVFIYAQNNPVSLVDPSGLQPPVRLPCTPADDVTCTNECKKVICNYPGPGKGKPRWNWGKCVFKVAVPIPGLWVGGTMLCTCDLIGFDVRPPGDCDPRTYKRLDDAVDKACNKRGGQNDNLLPCDPTKSWQVNSDRLKQMLKCADARETLAGTCFRGGDRSHLLRLIAIAADVAICARIIATQLPKPPQQQPPQQPAPPQQPIPSGLPAGSRQVAGIYGYYTRESHDNQ